MVSMPALFTSTSTGPSSFSTRSNMDSTWLRWLTSASTTRARRPLLSTHSATSQAFSHDPRWLMATSAPSSANISATPLPIPWLAPVINATLLRSFMSTYPLLSPASALSGSSSRHRPSARGPPPCRRGGSRETAPHPPGPRADSIVPVESFPWWPILCSPAVPECSCVTQFP